MELTSRVGLDLSDCRRVEACSTDLNPKEPEAQGNWKERKSLDLLDEVDNIQLECLLTRSQLFLAGEGHLGRGSCLFHAASRNEVRGLAGNVCCEARYADVQWLAVDSCGWTLIAELWWKETQLFDELWCLALQPGQNFLKEELE